MHSAALDRDVQSPPATAPAGLVGRAAECERIGRLIDEADGRGACLVIRGEPGVGKSALLEASAAEAAARGRQILRTAGALSERQLALSGLHKLLRPLLGEVERLPPPQRDALRCAFGLIECPAPGGFLVALAAFTLLTEAATVAPLLVLVEDAHWLDTATADVLAFIGRRLESDPIVLLASGRYADDDPLADAGLPELDLQPLAAGPSAELLAAVAPDLSAARCRRVLEAAAGNPLALVELPRALQSVADEADGRLPMTARLERAFALRASELAPPTRDLLLVAALNDSDSLAETLAATALLRPGAEPSSALAEAAGGLVTIDGEAIRFRHPLVRSALSQAASLDARHAAHGALAEVLADDPDRRVWHRAACVRGTDAAVADDLEASALRARRRGVLDAAIVALRRSAQLTAAGGERGRRLVRAAELATELGQGELSAALAAAAEPLELDPRDRLRLGWVRELADPEHGGAEHVRMLIDLAEQSRAAGDPDLALEILKTAAMRCWAVGFGAETEGAVLAATDRLGVGERDPRWMVISARAAPLTRGPEIAELLDRDADIAYADPGDLYLVGHAAACVGAFSRAQTLLSAAARGLREQGRLVQLAQALRLQAWSAARCSQWDLSLVAAEECARLADETRQPWCLADALSVRAMIVGLRGDVAAAERLAAEAEALVLSMRGSVTLATIQHGRAVVAAGAGRPADAFQQLRRVYRPGDPAHQRMQACWAIGSLAEYAVQSGNADAARAELARVEALAGPAPPPAVHLGLRYSRALLAAPDAAGPLFLAALDPALGEWPFDQARVRLAYGEWLRRGKRVIESREPLRAALATFERLGARGWAERARNELRAAGESRTRRAPEAWDQLTAQETQIAQMVADGLSNKEIGERLYLSHRTIASHLYRVFPKLGVTSRAQLARAVTARVTAHGEVPQQS